MANKADRAEKMIETLRRTDALERLRCLRALQEETPALRSEALDELLDAGWSKYAIAAELGISKQAVGQW